MKSEVSLKPSFVAPSPALYEKLVRSGPIRLKEMQARLTGPDLFVEVDSAMLVPFPKSRIVRRQQRIVRTGPEAA
jgi:hypothetical protein